jgi:signal transduction histidine kinase
MTDETKPPKELIDELPQRGLRSTAPAGVVEDRGADLASSRSEREERYRSARALKALSECNHALVRATSEPDLLEQICRILVQTAGYRLAWVGFAEQDDGKSVRSVAQAGFEEGYLETASITWADAERGRGPTGTSIRAGAPCIIKDVHTDPRFVPWREQAAQRGFASCAGLPLLADGNAFGAISVYAPEPNAFDREELQLLMDLAGNSAYGIMALRTREALKRSYDHLEQRVAQRTAELAAVNARLRTEIDERKQVELAVQKEQDLLRRLLVIHEQERQMVAYEIHDGFVQQATATLMHLQALQAQQRSGVGLSPESLDTAITLIRQSVAEARQLITGLRPPILDESGIVAALDFLVDEERKRGLAQIQFRHRVRFGRLAAPEETAIFRVVQESLANIRRHSGSKKVQVALIQQGDRIQLAVEDWGRGFDVQKVGKDRFGLRGIRERARLLGGWATIHSVPGQGTRVVVELPVMDRTAQRPEDGHSGHGGDGQESAEA